MPDVRRSCQRKAVKLLGFPAAAPAKSAQTEVFFIKKLFAKSDGGAMMYLASQGTLG
jgi:hypothetical protein